MCPGKVGTKFKVGRTSGDPKIDSLILDKKVLMSRSLYISKYLL